METDYEFTDTDMCASVPHAFICICMYMYIDTYTHTCIYTRVCRRKFPMLGNDPVPTGGVNVTRNA